ncbi:hypothetical protein ZWY2020_054239 [Hordeum vulgare]|nr:hypothetical protein ZWY2020_054239 [Hordeum vulgare]
MPSPMQHLFDTSREVFFASAPGFVSPPDAIARLAASPPQHRSIPYSPSRPPHDSRLITAGVSMPQGGGSSKMKTKTEASSSGKPKRPATAYILFIDEFKKEHPEMKKVTEISKAASREWARLGITGQASYFAEYRRLMEVYNQSKNVSVNTCDKPKRPPTAFFLFQQKFKQSHPALTKVVEISKAAGEEWRALGDAGRAPFFAEYDKLMDAFMQKKYPTNNPRAAPRRCPCACRCCRRCHVPAVPLSSPPPPQATSNSRAVASTVDGYSRAVASTFDGLNCEHVNDYSESEWTGLKHEGTVSGLEPSSLRDEEVFG